MPRKTTPPCPDCGKSKDPQRCSHAVCPRRRPVPADPSHTRAYTHAGGGYVKRVIYFD